MGGLEGSHKLSKRHMQEQEIKIRNANRYDVLCLRPYLLHLKEKELGNLHCEGCWEDEGILEFHHLRYGMDVTFLDLILLCRTCHQDVTDTSR